jgi:hypothetical protein
MTARALPTELGKRQVLGGISRQVIVKEYQIKLKMYL